MTIYLGPWASKNLFEIFTLMAPDTLALSCSIIPNVEGLANRMYDFGEEVVGSRNRKTPTHGASTVPIIV